MSSVAVVIATAPLEDSTGPLPHRLRAEADGRCHRPMLRRLIAARAAVWATCARSLRRVTTLAPALTARATTPGLKPSPGPALSDGPLRQ